LKAPRVYTEAPEPMAPPVPLALLALQAQLAPTASRDLLVQQVRLDQQGRTELRARLDP
jgi:hypothetical protein